MKLSPKDASYKATKEVITTFEHTHIVKTKYDIITEVLALLNAWSIHESLEKQNLNQNNTISLTGGKSGTSRFIYIQNDKRIITIQNPFSVQKSERKDCDFELVDPITNIVMTAKNVSILSILFNPKANAVSKSLNHEEDAYEYSPYSCLVDNNADFLGNNITISTFDDLLLDAFISIDESMYTTENIYKWWVLFCKFLSFDSEYVRYDEDALNEAPGHPKYHLDINLKSTFKVGLDQRYRVDDLFNFLDKNGNTPFLKFK